MRISPNKIDSIGVPAKMQVIKTQRKIMILMIIKAVRNLLPMGFASTRIIFLFNFSFEVESCT